MKKSEAPAGEHRWLTVVSPEQPDDVELLPEPATHPAVPPYLQALIADGTPVAQFSVNDVQAEYERLRGPGVTFTQRPTRLGAVPSAVITGPLRYTMTARDAVDLCRALHPRTVIPVHNEGWTHFRQNRHAAEQEFARGPGDLRDRVRRLPPEEPTELDS